MNESTPQCWPFYPPRNAFFLLKLGIKHFNIQWAKEQGSYGWCILLIFSSKLLVLLRWIVDYPYKRSSLWRDSQEKDTELPCPRWLRWCPERQRRITSSLCSRTNEDWFLAATVQFPSPAPIFPPSPAVTSAPLHVLSCLCGEGEGTRRVPLELEVSWSASWPLPTSPVSTEPTASGLHGEGLSGRPGMQKSSTFQPSYQIWLEVINELGVLLLRERQFWDSASVTLLTKIKGGGGGTTRYAQP